MISDQRAHCRVSFYMAGDMYKNLHGEKSGRIIIRDVSYSGLCIETLDSLGLGEIIFLDFEIAGRFQFAKAPAMVTRVKSQSGSHLSGVSLQKGDDRRRIRHALTYLMESCV